LDALIKLIEKLPEIFIYVVPGIIFLETHNYMCNKKTKIDNIFIMFSVFISFIIISIVKPFVIEGIWKLALIVIIISFISSILLALFYRNKLFTCALSFIGINKTIHNSMWDEIMDEYDVFIKLHISTDKVVYHGLYKGHEDKDENLYVLITDYDVKSYDGKDIHDYSEDRQRWAIINTKDISRVEIKYSEKSDRNKKIIKTN